MIDLFAVLEALTIPGGAFGDTPRVVMVSSVDPLAESLSQDAAVVFYWADGRAFLISVEQSGGPDVGQLHIWSVDENRLKQWLDFTHDTTDTTGASDEMDINNSGAGNTDLDGGWSIEGRSQGRGLVWFNDSTGVSTATGIGNWVVILSDPTVGGSVYRAGRAYRFTWRCLLNKAAAGAAFFSLRNTAGSVLIFDHGGKPAIAGTNIDTDSSIVLRNNTGSDITKTIGWYLNDVAGTTAGGVATSPCMIECVDCGAAADYPDALSV